jgi:hypothetical protein
MALYFLVLSLMHASHLYHSLYLSCSIHVTRLSRACSFATKQVVSAVVTRSTRGGTPQVQQPLCS